MERESKSPNVTSDKLRLRKLRKAAFADFLRNTDYKSKESFVIVRTHLLAEQLLNKILNEYHGIDYQFLEDARITFPRKLNLAAKSFPNFPNTVKESLETLNRIRNRCAHGFLYRPEQSEIESLFSKLKRPCVYDIKTVDLDSVMLHFIGRIIDELFK